MAKAVSTLLAGALLSVAVTTTAATPEVCVADEAVPCGTVLWTEGDANTNVTGNEALVAPLEAVPVDEAAAVPAGFAPAPVVGAVDQPEVTTRTIGPPTVVQPFANPALAAGQADVVLPAALPMDQQKLPPGPPNRLP